VIEPWIWFQPKDMVLVINQTHTTIDNDDDDDGGGGDDT